MRHAQHIPHIPSAVAPRARLAEWAGAVPDLPSQVRQDIRAELALRPVSFVQRVGPATEPEIASTALAARAIARIDQMAARTVGQSLFAAQTAPGAPPASGWQSAMAEPHVGFRAEPHAGFRSTPHARPEIRRHTASGPRRRAINGGARDGGELPDKLTGRAPLAGWSSPIATPQAGFVQVLPKSMPGEQAQFLRDVAPPARRGIEAPARPTTVPASRKLHELAAMIDTDRNGPLMAAGSDATSFSDIDRTTSASFSPLRGGDKLLFAGPVAATAAPAISTHSLIDPIGFAEQMRVALIEDARRHGIEV
jgi:hypothetical protein